MAGVYLKEPVSKIFTESGQGLGIEFAVSSCQGWRNTQEDAHFAHINFEKDTHIFGVFDGHNGPEVAEWARRYLPEYLAVNRQYKAGNIVRGLAEAFVNFDINLLNCYDDLRKIRAEMYPELPEFAPGITSGSTAVVLILKNKKIFVAGVGDTRCLLCRNNQTLVLSRDTTPEDPDEAARINRSGLQIIHGRIDGKINLSRALGDHMFKKSIDMPIDKQAIVSLPLIFVEPHVSADQFLILFCDGIWNAMDNETLSLFVQERIQTKSLKVITEEIIEKILPKTFPSGGVKGKDNMTVMIIKFPNAKGLRRTPTPKPVNCNAFVKVAPKVQTNDEYSTANSETPNNEENFQAAINSKECVTIKPLPKVRKAPSSLPKIEELKRAKGTYKNKYANRTPKKQVLSKINTHEKIKEQEDQEKSKEN